MKKPVGDPPAFFSSDFQGRALIIIGGIEFGGAFAFADLRWWLQCLIDRIGEGVDIDA